MAQALWDSSDRLSVLLRWLTIVAAVAACAFPIAIYYVSDRIGQLQSDEIKTQGSNLKSQSDTISGQAARIEDQNRQVGALNGEIDRLRQTAAELTQKAAAAERNVADTYDFNGVHRLRAGGKMTVIAGGPEMEAFSRMLEAQNNRDWERLSQEADSQIASTPRWLTPYLFSGVALVNKGDLSGAQERLRHVMQSAGGDPAYNDAGRILQQVEAAMQVRPK